MSSTPVSPLHLAVALDGTGWHPASWREQVARPRDLLTAGHWAGLVAEAERGLLDFVTFEDGLGLQSSHYGELDGRTDQVRGRLDAVLTASRIAPLTRHIGLVPTVIATHTEPFHISKAIATLDYVSTGRAGLRVQISARPHEADHFGRRTFPPISLKELRTPAGQQRLTELFDEAADHVEVVRRLWDSWEDDAEIRDAATGRFIDRDKLHYIDFEGEHFSVKGPSITPRPPQGQPLVTALAHQTVPYRLVARQADLGYITPQDADDARAIVAEIRAEQEAAAAPANSCTSSATWWSSSTTTRPPRRTAAHASTPSRESRTRATHVYSPVRPPNSPICCRSWGRRGSPASGCGPPSPGTTCPRSPGAWSPNSSAATPSAPPTRPTPCADCWA